MRKVYVKHIKYTISQPVSLAAAYSPYRRLGHLCVPFCGYKTLTSKKYAAIIVTFDGQSTKSFDPTIRHVCLLMLISIASIYWNKEKKTAITTMEAAAIVATTQIFEWIMRWYDDSLACVINFSTYCFHSLFVLYSILHHFRAFTKICTALKHIFMLWIRCSILSHIMKLQRPKYG